MLRKALAAQLASPERVVVIRDGVEAPPQAPRYRARSTRRIVIDVGALYEVKGQAKILERALPWLQASRRHYLVFVGGTRTAPSYVEGMKRLVAERALERQVRFLGSRDDVPRLLGIADALVAFSSVEGIPRVVMEAMLAGRPVIVSNSAGMDEVVVDGEAGRVIDFDAAENPLAGCLAALSADLPRWQAMGRRGLARAAGRYSTRAMSQAIQSLYNDLLHARPKS